MQVKRLHARGALAPTIVMLGATESARRLIEENAKWVRDQQNETIVSLNYDKYNIKIETYEKNNPCPLTLLRL